MLRWVLSLWVLSLCAVCAQAGDVDPLEGAEFCPLNTVCPQGDAWRDQIRSTAGYSYNGSSWCSGQLVTDANHSGRPYFLTVSHCGLSAANAASLVVYWRFESPTCGALGGGSLAFSQTGSTLRARSAELDFVLVELDEPPPAAYGVYASGFDRRTDDFVGGAVIHHPNTTENGKFIWTEAQLATDFDTVRYVPPGPSATSIVMDQIDAGSLNFGSSGGGLWRSDSGGLTGLLQGADPIGCPGGVANFVPLSAAWDGADPTVRLRDWLDPGDTGVMWVDGFDAVIFSDGFESGDLGPWTP